MVRHSRMVGVAVSVALLLLVCVGIATVASWSGPSAAAAPRPGAAGDLVVLAWNDLGMHCYNPSFDEIGVLPPWNTLWAQVVRVGDPPQVVTTGITVTFFFSDNTTSVTKSNFWDANPYATGQNAELLFGLSGPLPPDIGLAGTGLSGTMHLDGDHFVAEGIPLTEYRDSDPSTPYPYQLATVVVLEAGTGNELARSVVVAPVSTEMHCENCHYDGGPGNEDFSTGVVELNILSQHDDENWEEYPAGTGRLVDHMPVLCADCHASNALGLDGAAGIPSLSNAIHDKHKEEVPGGMAGCYNCHPGPQTQCLRDVMSSQYGLDCASCHGTMADVSENPDPWFHEPRCDNASCHSAYKQDKALYRMSKEHGGVYCAACHDSPHAIAPSTQPNDALKFIAWQGHAGPLDTCTVCHASTPPGLGPHGTTAPSTADFAFRPNRSSAQQPGAQVVYTHILDNRGTVSDTYDLTWSSSQGWSMLPAELASVGLLPGAQAVVSVTVSVPGSDAVRGLTDRTIVTATSRISPTQSRYVSDITYVSRMTFYLPLVFRGGEP